VAWVSKKNVKMSHTNVVTNFDFWYPMVIQVAGARELDRN